MFASLNRQVRRHPHPHPTNSGNSLVISAFSLSHLPVSLGVGDLLINNNPENNGQPQENEIISNNEEHIASDSAFTNSDTVLKLNKMLTAINMPSPRTAWPTTIERKP